MRPMQYASRVSAIRRELNRHDAAKPRAAKDSLRHRAGSNFERGTEKTTLRPFRQSKQSLGKAAAMHGAKDMWRPRRIAASNRAGATGLQSVRRAAADEVGAFSIGSLRRRLVYVARQIRRRGAGSTCAGQTEIAWSGGRHTASPNPSVEARPNGGPPGPGRRYAVHFRRPGPGVPPSAPPHLQR